MTPWFEQLVKAAATEHDTECIDGADCGSRTRHLDQVFVPQALKRRVVALQARLAAVEEVHIRREYWTETGEDICDTCSRRKQNDFVYWPCDTIKAVRGE